jgi:hypothetical protein
MSSKGTPIKTLRVPEDLSTEVQETIDRRNMWSRETAWTWTDFCLVAIREKIDKMRRSRESRRSR